MLKKIANLITNNIGLKLLAFLFATLIWLTVVNIDDPTQTASFTTSVTIDNGSYLTELGKYFEIVDDVNTVTFKVSAKRSVLRALSNSDFKAVADMSRIEDMSRIPVDLSVTRYTSMVKFTGAVPYLEVNVEDLQEKQLVIGAHYTGIPAEGYVVDGVSLLSSNVLKISGPQSVVSTIDSARAVINVEGISSTITDSVVPVLLDANGNSIDTTKLSMNVQVVNIKAEIKDTKHVSIAAVTSGTQAEGYVITEITCSPDVVSVKGNGRALNSLNEIVIPTELLSIEGASEDTTWTIDISSYLPEGVSLVNEEEKKVTVTATLEEEESRVLELPTDRITLENIPKDRQAEFVADHTKITIKGLKSDLDQVTVDNISAMVDLSGLKDGTHTITLNLELNAEKCTIVGMPTVRVKIEEIPKEENEDEEEIEESTQKTSSSSNTKKNTTIQNIDATEMSLNRHTAFESAN